jgi:hypothetical protein
MKTISTYRIKLFFNCALLSALMGNVLTSCESFVEVDLPKSQLTNTAVFENYATANAALTDIYSKIRDQGILTGRSSGISNQLGNYTDELTCYGIATDPTLVFYTNALLPTTSTIADYWKYSYNHIYAANAVIQGVELSTTLTMSEKKQLTGEALFIRALLHFYLTSLYGNVPYVNSTDYKINSTIGKSSVKDLYTKVILDLQTAVTLLNPQYSKAERTRPTIYVVKALLARVYLYNENWPEAANESSALLNESNLFRLESSLNLAFLKESKETIWQLQSSVSGKNSDQAASFIFFTTPPTAVALSSNFISSFSTGDLRKANWIGSLTNGTSTWYYPYKYKQFYNTPVSQEYSIVFRLAEQYLIRAEARAMQGDIIGAREDLDLVRKRAGLPSTTAVSQQEILNAIADERRWELFTEFGHRFFDLKRTGRIDSTLTPVKPGWNSGDSLMPLPQVELNLNPNLLPQNMGY